MKIACPPQRAFVAVSKPPAVHSTKSQGKLLDKRSHFYIQTTCQGRAHRGATHALLCDFPEVQICEVIDGIQAAHEF